MTADPQDLEVIMTCLEVSALTLTDPAGARFTKQQLFDGAKAMMPALDERDMETVLGGMGYAIRRVGRELELK